MATIGESTTIRASLAETWEYYFEPSGWPAWVDGFGAVESAERYPEAGGLLVWSSTPAGRGTVSERVLAHEPRTLHRISFADPASSGELATRFEVEGEGTTVALELDYRLAREGPLARATDLLFVRSQIRASMRRTLARLRLELEEAAAAPSGTAPSAPADR